MMVNKIEDYFKKHKFSIASIFTIFLLFLLYNHKLVLNLSTALTDWLDYPLIVYILSQNIKHISQLDFQNVGNMPSFYPSPGGMFFTDILLIQGFLGVPIYFLSKNYIFTHNIIFLLTGFLNIISLHFFWDKFFKQKIIVSILSVLFIFSPYYFSEYVHFQMVSYWFFFFSAGILVTAKSNKEYLFAGVLSGLQFLSGVYLGIYSLTISALILLWQLYSNKKLLEILKKGIIYSFGFFLIAGIFVYKYSEVKSQYEITRNPGEYVDYGGQITDVFFNPYPSFWTQTIYGSVNKYIYKRGPNFTIGWILLLSSIVGMVVVFKNRQKKETYLILFIAILIWGIIAYLGPRLAINGHFIGTPLPYAVFLKYTPLFDALRGTARWFFFIQIGLLFFIGKAFEYILKKYKLKKAILILTVFFVLYLFEIFPLQQRTAVEQYYDYPYEILINDCKKEKDVLLEYPFYLENIKKDVGPTLNYWVKMLLNLMHHDCFLVNGYSGYDPQHFTDFKNTFEDAVWNGSTDDIIQTLETKQVNFIKINKKKLFENMPQTLLDIADLAEFEILLEDDTYLVVKKIK